MTMAGLLSGCRRFPVRNAKEEELESVHTFEWVQKANGYGEAPIADLVFEARRYDRWVLRKNGLLRWHTYLALLS